MSTADEIAKLAQLRDQGIINNDEFEAQKAAILRGDQRSGSPATASAPTKKSMGKGCLIVAAVIVILLIIGAIVSGGGSTGGNVVAPTSDNAGADNKATADAEASGPSLTMDGYNRVKNGMTYDQVVAIVGKPSQELSRNEMAGTETVMYSWEGSLGANMNAMFQNNKLVQKAQFGLR